MRRCVCGSWVLTGIVLAMMAPRTAAQPIITAWNPLYSVGDWDWNIPLPTPSWLHLPTDPTGSQFPMPGHVPDNGSWLFFVTISNAKVVLHSNKQISGLLIDLDGKLFIETPAANLLSLVSVANQALIQIDSDGMLETPIFENAPAAELRLTTLGHLWAYGALGNHGVIVGNTGGIITTTVLDNFSDGLISISPGGLALNTGVINNDGEIRLELSGSELLSPLSALTLDGGGRLILEDQNSSVTSVSSINNLGDHTIRGKGNIQAPVLNNDSFIQADEAEASLNLLVGSLDNSGSLLAFGSSRMDVVASSVSNSGLLEASDHSRIDIDASSLENSTVIRAIDNSIVKIENAAVDNDAALIEALETSVVQFEKVDLHGGQLSSDADSLFTVTGSQSFMRDITLDGLLRVAPGGYLNLYSTIDNRDGEINIDSGGHVDFEYLTNSTLIGGLVSGAGTISKEYHHGLTLDATNGMHFEDFDMTVYPGGFLKLIGHLTNDATIRMYHDGVTTVANTYIQVDGNGLIDGSGKILFMEGSSKNQIIAATPGSTLTNAVTHMISSSGPNAFGHISIDLINHGMVESAGGYVLVNGPTIRNDGNMQSRNAGILDIGNFSPGTVLDNTDGFIRALGSGSTRLTNLLVKEGTLAGDGIIDIQGVTTLESTEMHNIGHVRVASQQNLVLRGSFLNDGLIESHSSDGFTSRIYLDGHVILDGAGSMAFSSSHSNYLLPVGVNNGSLTQMAGHTITTMNPASDAEIPVKITNYGTVDADNGNLYLSSKTNINRGLMEASNGGWLAMGIGNDTATLDNVGGTLRAGAGSQITLANFTVTGGTIEGDGSVVPQTIIAPVIFEGTAGMYLNANIDLYTGNGLRLVGDIENDGDIRMHGDAFSTALGMVGELDLTGTGQVSFRGSFNNRIVPVDAGARLFNHAGHTFRSVGPNSQGVFDINFTNDGLIEADDGAIYVRTVASSHVNRGVIRAVNTGFLMFENFFGNAVLDNQDGTLFVDQTSSFVHGGVTIKGGHLDGAGYFTIQGGNTYDGSTSSGSVTIDANTYIGWAGSLVLKGEITNNGRMVIADNEVGGPASHLVASGSVSLGGTGSIQFSGPYENRIVNADLTPNAHRLIQGPDHSIFAIGPSNVANMRVDLTNEGLVEINNATMYWDSISNANSGTIRAINGAMLWIGDPHNTAVLDNKDGEIFVDATSTIIPQGATIRGGRLAGDGVFYIQGGSTYDGSTPSGAITLDAITNIGYIGRLVARGSIINNNRWIIADADFAGAPAALVIDGAASITGSGSIQFNNSWENLLAGNPGAHLTVGPNQLITVSPGSNGYISVPMVLNGTMSQDGGAFWISNTVVNNGLIRSTSSAMLQQFFLPIGGTGGWLADGGSLYFHGGAHPTTTGPITLRNGGIIYYNSNNVTGSDLTIDSTSIVAVAGSTQIHLTGNMSFATSTPANWSWNASSVLHMEGGVPGPQEDATFAFLEVGGSDSGVDPENHVGNPAGFANSNYYIPHLVIGPDAHVALIDLLNNGHRGGSAGNAEALYVNALTFANSGGVLNLNGLHLYFNSLVGNPSQIVNSLVPEPSFPAIIVIAVFSTLLRRRRSRVTSSASGT